MPNDMHSLDSNSSNVPAFLVKLWKLVEDPACDDLIAWSDSGFSFIIKDQARFAKDLLPQYFKHNNMASFVRQLNMYGFKKKMNYEKSGLRNDNNEMEFQHGFFVKEKCELLELIKRKISNPKIAETAVKSNPKDILVDLSSIREKQENMDNMLLKMKSENELLWRELTTMRQKHKAQEQIIQKVIQFLVSMVQRNNPNIGVQRKIARMLHNSPNSKANSSQVSRTIDVLRKKNSDCIIVPEQIVSPHGPVIHEVTDGDHEDNLSTAASPVVNVASPCVKSPESVKDSPCSPKYRLVSLLNNSSNPSGSIEPLTILEALTPKTPAADSDNTTDESILGIPLEYISLPSDTEVASIISIPDTANMISLPEDNGIGNVISIPEGGSISDIITVPESSLISNIISIPEESGSKSISNAEGNCASAEETGSGFLTDIASLGDLQPSTSQDMVAYSPFKGFFEDDLLSESLQTPKIELTEENICSLSKELKQKSKDVKKNQIASKNITHNEHNYQLATTECSSLKNKLSNHLLSVDEKLNFTQDRLSSNPWNYDYQKLLGVCASPYSWTSFDSQLFSNDDGVSCDAFTSLDDMDKVEPNDVIGNELVQFNPNFLEGGIDFGLNEYLLPEAEVPSGDLCYQPISPLDEVLNVTNTSEEANLLYGDSELNISPNKRRRAGIKSQKSKRHKEK